MASDSSLKFTKLSYILDNLNVSGLHVKKITNLETILLDWQVLGGKMRGPTV